MTISPYTGVVPSRGQRPEQFANNADAWVTWLTSAVPEFNALAEDLRAAAIGTGGENYKGEYNAAVTYAVGDSVSVGRDLFVAKTENTGVAPVDGANWYRVLFKGVIRPGFYQKREIFQSDTTFVVPEGINTVRAYAGGKGGDGASVLSSGGGGGGGGGFSFGNIIVGPGEELVLTFTAGVAKITRNGIDLLVANPGGDASGATPGTGGTATVHESVVDGFAYSGGPGGGPGPNTCGGGGGSAGSPLGNGFAGGSNDEGGGGGGIGGAGDIAGGGAGSAAEAFLPGGADSNRSRLRLIPFTDPLLAPLIYPGFVPSSPIMPGVAGPGGGGGDVSGRAASGGFGGGGGGNQASGFEGWGGELGGGGGTTNPNAGKGGSSLACGGGGGNISSSGEGAPGGPATIWLFY